MSVKDFTAHAFSLNGSTVLGLKRLDRNRRGCNGFQYPDENESVSAEKWKANTKCGNGLHFWPWGLGVGDGCHFSVATDVFAVVEANLGEVVGLIDGGVKAKAKTLKVVKYGSFAECMAILVEGRLAYIASKAKKGAASSGGWSSAASSGDGSNAASSGVGSSAASSGEQSIAVAIGRKSEAMSDTAGAMLVLVGRMEDGTPVCVSGIVGDRFKPGVAYTLNDAGEAVEVKGDE